MFLYVDPKCFFFWFYDVKGAGIYLEGFSESTILNTAFMGNRAGYDGGGIYATDRSDFICHWCTFDTNSVSKKGGAVFLNYDSDAYFESTAFRNNYVTFFNKSFRFPRFPRFLHQSHKSVF